eukprot:TRINITY_DN5521_c0_g1_i1.p1 TRINITY_DN5521_c0_g1~~TRINITY_DN5521_c0_g1_i1.p1  ORF type:complete len:366 (-),score=35.40 TRINITY_DN5521_c0_g1_i1:52-1050(-)
MPRAAAHARCHTSTSCSLHRALRCKAPTARHVRSTSCAYQAEQTAEGQMRYASAPSKPYGEVNAESIDDEECFPAFVSYRNSDEATELNVKIQDYQGLLHVVSWVLKGMEVRVKNAKLQTEDGFADDTFIITTLKGGPLSPSRAREVADRVADFVMHCSPGRNLEAIEWQAGMLHITNDTDGPYSEVTVLDDGTRIGFLLQVASVMTGIGVMVNAAEVRTCSECSQDEAFKLLLKGNDVPVKRGRVIKMRVTEDNEGKLSERSVKAVIFSLQLLLGKGHAPTVVPNIRSYATRFKDENGARQVFKLSASVLTGFVRAACACELHSCCCGDVN